MPIKVIEMKKFKVDYKFPEPKCHICGETFINGWRFQNHIYCSYHCMRVDEKKYLEKINKKLLDK